MHFPFADPAKPVKMPAHRRLKSLAHIAWSRLLPVSWTFRAGACISGLGRRLRPSRQEQMVGLLEPFVPPGTTRRDLKRHVAVARMVRRMGARTYAPVFRRSKDWLVQALQPEGLEHLEETKRTGGAIVLQTHAGMIAWVGPVLHQLGYPVRLTQRRRMAAEALILMHWDGLIPHVLPYPDDLQSGYHLKALHDLLKAGAWIEQAGDYPDDESGLEAMYLGFGVRCVRAPWVLARLADRPVIPVLMLTDRALRPKFLIGEPIWVARSGDATGAMTAALQTYLDFAGRHVSRMPWNLNLIHRADLIREGLPVGWHDRT